MIKRFLGAILAFFAASVGVALAGSGTITVKDSNGNVQTFFVVTNSSSYYSSTQAICDGTAAAQCAAVKAASTAAAAGDPALVVAISPNNTIPSNVTQFGGTNVSTGTGSGGSGIPRVTVSSDSEVKPWDGTNIITVKAASTSAAQTDTALVERNPDLGSVSDTAYAGSGSGSVVAILKGLYTGVTSSIPAGSATIGNVGATVGSSVPSVAVYLGGQAVNVEPSATSNGDLVGVNVGIEGKLINLPYANKENMLRGANSSTGTGATTIIAAQSGFKTYITAVECSRTDAGTTASYVTLSDGASTKIALPNSGGGGVNNVTFPVPLVTSTNTAFTFTSSASISTVYCNAQGYAGT